MKTILKVDTLAKRINNTREKPIPNEMLPKTNRNCGKWGHRWTYTNDMKICTNYLCEVKRPYTPNRAMSAAEMAVEWDLK